MGKVYIGSTQVSKVYIGTSAVQKIYCGTTLIYPMYEAFSLTFSVVTQYITVTCNRTASPNAGAATGPIYSGNTIYTGDVLQFTITSSSGYYVYEATTRDSTSYTETITVSGNVDKQYHAVIKQQLNVNTRTASFSSGGQYPWSQTFTVTDAIIDSSGTYYPWVSSTLESAMYNGRISSASSTSITAAGWGTSANSRVMGAVYYYQFAPEASPLTAEPYVDGYDTSAPFWMDINNDNSVTAMLEIKGYVDTGTDYWEESDWVEVFDIPGENYNTLEPVFFGWQDSELVGCSLEMRFKYTSGGTTYYSGEYTFDI